MNKKGFTLIELLAVIVILAIIALIATPIVMGYINVSKKKTTIASAEMYLKAAEQAIIEKVLDEGKTFDVTSCSINEKNLICSGKEVKLKVNGTELPKSGNISFEDDTIKSAELIYGESAVIKDSKGDLVYHDASNFKTYDNGEVVYFDVVTGTSCTESQYNSSNSNTGYNGIVNYTCTYNSTTYNNDCVPSDKLSTQNSCLKFYAFNDEGGAKLNLLLDHDVALDGWGWDYATGPDIAVEELKLATDSWNGTLIPTAYSLSKEYLVDKDDYGNPIYNHISYNIDYSNHKARLITIEDIAQITGKEDYNASYHFSFDTNNTPASETCKSGDTSGCKYGWLYDRTNKSCTTYGCLNDATNSSLEGYWTASIIDGSIIWYVNYQGQVTNMKLDFYFGIRPVIEILKSNL